MRGGIYWTALVREGRGGRTRRAFLIFCLALGVGAVVSVRGLIDGVHGGMAQESRSLLSADIALEARSPIPDAASDFFAKLEGAEATSVIDLTTMARATADDVDTPPASRRVQLRVVDGRYPFYGVLSLEPAGDLQATLGDSRCVVAPELLDVLGLTLGDELQIGQARFEIAARLVEEPGRLDIAFVAGPRVYISAAGFERSQLGGFGSRARYKALFALPQGEDLRALEALKTSFEETVAEAPWIRVRTHQNAQPTVSQIIDRVGAFLGLVALLSLLLGGLGVAQITRAWVASRTRHVAILRCLGWRPREIMRGFLIQIAILAFVGSGLGVALGALATFIVPQLAPEVLPPDGVSWWQPAAWGLGLGLGIGIALIFSLLPLTAIWRVPPSQVLREEARPLKTPKVVSLTAALLLILGIFGSALVQTGRGDQALGFSAVIVLTTLVLGAAAWTLTRLARVAPRAWAGPYLRHGLAALARPGAGTIGAVVALGVGVLVVFGMWVVESQLRAGLASILPEEAPSCFLLDIQPDQWEGVHAQLGAAGATRIQKAPLVTGRLRAIGGRRVRDLIAARKDGRRGRWVLTREQRLSTRPDLPADNVITASLRADATPAQPWNDPEPNEVSIEAGYAEDMGVQLGETLTIDIQGVPIDLVVSSLRNVEWRSFGINFFLIVEPGVIDAIPGYQLAVARIPESTEAAFQDGLAASFPNVTVIRIREVVTQVMELLTQVAVAVRGLGLFTIFVGLVILCGAVAASSMRRGKEVALLKALGVRRRGIAGLFMTEYGLLGILAGFIGGSGALILAGLFFGSSGVDLDVGLPWMALPLVGLGSALLAIVCGLLASARALSAPPIENLRSTV